MPAHHRSGGLAALAITQVVAWGVLFYAVLVAAPAIAAETGWSDEHIFLAITAGLLTSAGCAIPVGRWLDRHPRRVMVSGAIVGTGALLAAAASPSIWSFAAAWTVCGAAQAAVLYQAAFTVITHRYRSERRGPLTLVTLAVRQWRCAACGTHRNGLHLRRDIARAAILPTGSRVPQAAHRQGKAPSTGRGLAAW